MFWNLILVFAQLCLCHLVFIRGEAFTSTANLVHLVEGEQGLLQDFEDYVENQKKRLAVLGQKVDTEYDKEKLEAEKKTFSELRSHVEEIQLAKGRIDAKGALYYAGNPIDAYRLIKRWNRILALTSTDLNFSKKFKNLPTPTDDDVVGAIAALLRLQRVFAMATEDMEQGAALTEMGVHSLTKDDCLKIGKIALDNKDFGLAIQWTEIAIQDQENPTPEVQLTLAKGYLGIGDHVKALDYAQTLFSSNQSNLDYQTLLGECRTELKKHGKDYIPTVTPKSWQRPLADWRVNYEKLCRGEIDATADPAYAKDLVCRYRKSASLPYIVYKEEILSWEPRIGMFYDVITEREAQFVISKAYPKLYRAKVGDPASAYATSERISKVAWLWDSDSPVIKGLSKKVSTVTGLDTTFSYHLSRAEPFQVVNYGMGGQYEPHVDFYEDPIELSHNPEYLQNTGDRISTFLYYLSDIRIGGATVFPKINIRVPPVKNAAAFWYNAKLSGELDTMTQHAGCPVLAGQKWVVNKWIRQRGQEFTRPCGMTPDAVDRS